jgi:hypothetical protein
MPLPETAVLKFILLSGVLQKYFAGVFLLQLPVLAKPF